MCEGFKPRKVPLPFFDQLFQVGLMFGSQHRSPGKSPGHLRFESPQTDLKKLMKKKETRALILGICRFVLLQKKT